MCSSGEWLLHLLLEDFYIQLDNVLNDPLIFSGGSQVRERSNYSKTCLKRPCINRQNKGVNDKW